MPRALCSPCLVMTISCHTTASRGCRTHLSAVCLMCRCPAPKPSSGPTLTSTLRLTAFATLNGTHSSSSGMRWISLVSEQKPLIIVIIFNLLRNSFSNEIQKRIKELLNNTDIRKRFWRINADNRIKRQIKRSGSTRLCLLHWLPEIFRTFTTCKVEKIGDDRKTIVAKWLVPVLDET